MSESACVNTVKEQTKEYAFIIGNKPKYTRFIYTRILISKHVTKSNSRSTFTESYCRLINSNDNNCVFIYILVMFLK